MRYSTDDGRFGFVLTKLSGRGMFKFQIVVDAIVVGDDEPCILGTAMVRLRDLALLETDRLDFLSKESDDILLTLRTDDTLNEAAQLSIAESLDNWRIFAYVNNENVVFLSQSACGSLPDGPALISVVPVAEYNSIVEIVHNHWLSSRDGDLQK